MWTRKELKLKAKNGLKISYWKAFLVSILIAGGGGFNFSLGNRNSPNHITNKIPQHIDGILYIILPIIIILIFVLMLAYAILLYSPIEVGAKKYYSQAAQQNVDLNNVSYSFNKVKYYNIIKTMFFRAFYNFLWYFLFIIPGFIKFYSYRMVPYILADNPNLNYKQVITLSKKMTRGHKFNIFILDLSFIGWYMLGLLAFVVGIIFVIPYQMSTEAELYLVLRQNALNNGICSYEDLMLSKTAQP